MALLNETRTANNNISSYDELIRRTNSIEAQVIAWMAEATTLHGDVDVPDKQTILDLRASLIAKLTAATAI